MAKISTQASNTIVVLEKLGKIAYKKFNVDEKSTFSDVWRGFKSDKGRINPVKIFVKSGKVQNFKLNLSESSARLLLSVMAYLAYCVEVEEYESLRVENNHIWMNIHYDDFESITYEVFLHRDKLGLIVLAEPGEER